MPLPFTVCSFFFNLLSIILAQKLVYGSQKSSNAVLKVPAESVSSCWSSTAYCTRNTEDDDGYDDNDIIDESSDRDLVAAIDGQIVLLATLDGYINRIVFNETRVLNRSTLKGRIKLNRQIHRLH
ncbi:hypothetical protein BDB00DRAFT_943010 [Zychaea mexicana]|uniref:uncharacterized protein n=1 Tax=Zychaea mexicana TaxID=64656 RepID=UPI0022FE554C|nr:uncharacterized protein BDB00DRAFT_943010 [Zychaea mexicana]KAI9484596.1 hypothetical protein BDB00DRAFT_943010 [Zychaea mexicana]